jgi:pimeloyl-ACP methyl ester carboxylesterase
MPAPAGFTLAGTLTVPPGASAESPVPCAVLISGSGQQDRDETLLGHKPFMVIADRLTRAGIAVFRYDDRGVGESGGRDQLENATSKDFADDAAAVVEFLKTQPPIDPKRIGLIGHSEGGLIAPMVATMRDDVAFIVLLAGPGVTGREILELQLKLILRAEGQSDEDIVSASKQQKALLDLAVSGASEEEIAERIKTIHDETMAALPASTQPEADEDATLEEVQIKAQIQAVNNAWMKFFLTFDPRPTLAKVTCPVLAVNGTLDLQVWHDQNLPEIEKALSGAGADFTIKRYENLNHLFQPARTGGMSEYAASEITFDDAVIHDMIAWIKDKLKVL